MDSMFDVERVNEFIKEQATVVPTLHGKLLDVDV